MNIVIGRQGIETQYAFEFYTTDSGQRMDEWVLGQLVVCPGEGFQKGREE